MQPLVSVIVPAFNSAWCVERTLASIAAQTYANLEVIVVNDGSTDDTASVVRSCIAGDARFRLVDQDNRGLVGARNRGIEESRGRLYRARGRGRSLASRLCRHTGRHA